MLHIYTGSTQANRGSDEFRLHEAYRELRARLDTDGMLDLNTTDVPVRGATPGQLIELASTVPFLAQARFVVVEGLLASLGSARGVATEWQPLVDARPLAAAALAARPRRRRLPAVHRAAARRAWRQRGGVVAA